MPFVKLTFFFFFFLKSVTLNAQGEFKVFIQDERMIHDIKNHKKNGIKHYCSFQTSLVSVSLENQSDTSPSRESAQQTPCDGLGPVGAASPSHRSGPVPVPQRVEVGIGIGIRIGPR